MNTGTGTGKCTKKNLGPKFKITRGLNILWEQQESLCVKETVMQQNSNKERQTGQRLATEMIVSATMLREDVQAATNALNGVFMFSNFTRPGHSEVVKFYAANITKDSIDRHVVVEGKTAAGLRAALRNFSAPVQKNEPLLVTERAMRQIQKAAKTRKPGWFYSMERNQLPDGAKSIYSEDEMRELYPETTSNLSFQMIRDINHPAFLQPSAQGFVSWMTIGARDLEAGSFVASYEHCGMLFLGDEDKAGTSTRSLRDNEFFQPPLGDAKDRSVIINGNAIRNPAVTINDYRNTGQSGPNCKFVSYLHVPSDPTIQPRLVVLVIVTRAVSKGDEILLDYGAKYWEDREDFMCEREELNQWLRQRYNAHMSGQPQPPLPSSLVSSKGALGSEMNVDREIYHTMEEVNQQGNRTQRQSAKVASIRIKKIQMSSEEEVDLREVSRGAMNDNADFVY